jgi:hypothetical protein
LYVVKQISLANYLLLKKCTLNRIDRDREDRARLIFLFQDDDQLQKYIGDYKRDGVTIGYQRDSSNEVGRQEH